MIDVKEQVKEQVKKQSVAEAAAAAGEAVRASLVRVSSGLGEMTRHLAQTAGKGARTALLLNAAADGGGLVTESAVKAAAAVELLHMATLVHDDVIDDSPMRRGMETAQKAFGKRNAVVCGDYLLCMSLSALTGIEVGDGDRDEAARLTARLARVLGSICVGEYDQGLNNGNADLGVFDYLRIISGKTAALFYISAYIGGKLGGEDERGARALGRFGKYMGMMFQMYDDCKDYEFSEEQARKPVGGDAAGGVVTLPLILAIRKAPGLRDMAVEAMKYTGGGGIAELIEAVKTVGGTDETRLMAERYAVKAEKVLSGVEPFKRDRLSALLQNMKSAMGVVKWEQ